MYTITVLGQGTCDFDGEFSLLEALDEQGFDMPYSCRGGNCGACQVKLTSGTVEYVQTPIYEAPKGYILTCSTIPTSDIEIEIP